MTDNTPEKPTSGLLSLVLLAFCSLHLIYPVLWLLTVLQGDVDIQRDWYHLWWVGQQFAAGEWDGLYSLDATPETEASSLYFWRYPPFAFYLVWPLSWLGQGAAYATLVIIELLAMIGALWLMLRTVRLEPHVLPWAAAILCSAPAASTLIIGQSSGLLLLVLAAAVFLWHKDKRLLACIVLGLLAIKPNWGIFFGLFALVWREWRGAGAMLGVVGLLVLSSLPLGTGIWQQFLDASFANDAVVGQYEAFKQITLKGFLGAVLPQAFSGWVWALCSVGLVLWTGWTWTRLKTSGRGAHALGLTLLLAVAVNPYASFYDALVLAVPATLWWANRERYPRTLFLSIGGLIGLMWVWEYFTMYYAGNLQTLGLNLATPFSLVGPCAALWLVFEGLSATKNAENG